ncbi:unnamed protein product [Sympodiomycopsis kandeliae]
MSNPNQNTYGGAPPPAYAPTAPQGHRPGPQFQPPPGPPPGHVGPPPGQSSGQGPVYPPPSSAPPPSAGSGGGNPFADPSAGSAPTSTYPGMQSGAGNPFTGGSSGSGNDLNRHNSIQSHVQRMGSLNAGQPDSGKGMGGAAVPAGSEDALSFLSSFDTIFVVDDSGSMVVQEEHPDGRIGKSRREEARDALAGMVELAAKYDDDGIDVHFLNSFESLEGVKDPRQVIDLFERVQPNGPTPTGEKLEMLLLSYLDEIEEHKAGKRTTAPKKRSYIIITDGSPSDDPESVIVAIARRLDQGRFPLSQIGIQFLQCGSDAAATESLKELDDALSKEHQIRDMVDTVPYTGMQLSPDTIVKALLGSVNRKYDKMKN